MQTSSASSKKSIEKGIYIKGCFKSEKASNSRIHTNTDQPEFRNDKGLIRDFLQNEITEKNQKVKLVYVLQEGDYKRLNRNGVLRVYNINEPIDIPVKGLLGKWRNDYIGVAFILINDSWHIGGKISHNETPRQEPGLGIAFRNFIKFAME